VLFVRSVLFTGITLMKKIVSYALATWMSVASMSAFGFEKNIVDTAVEAGKFKTLAAALGAAGLVDAVKGPGPFTVFAPSDEAFAKLPKGTVETLLKPENKEKLKAILTYHVVPGKVMAKDVLGVKGAKSLNGQRIDVKVDGGKVMVDGAQVVATDIACTNGVIHVIDSVILPSEDNIPTVATKAGKFNTLLAAAKAAGLVEALSGDKALTVFAPTDDAFAKLPKDTVATLLKPENKDKLKAILLFHVVEGRVYSEDALAAKSAATLQGSKVEITVKDGAAYVNGAKILATDVDASNGVIHIIDSVILPPAK
jgi:transforming growth factor-beta-induced protein